MATFAVIVINGIDVQEFRNGYESWFFRKSDRVRDCSSEGSDGSSVASFIGYRATAGTIRRRMVLAGYDMPACADYFQKNLRTLIADMQMTIESLQETYPDATEENEGDNRTTRNLKTYRSFIDAVKDTSLVDWISAFPDAVKLQNDTPTDYFSGAWWYSGSQNSLVNAMLSYVPTYAEFELSGMFNFPGPHWDYFTAAFLASCPDNAVCELNISQLISAGWSEDFRDLDEIQREETYPHRNCRESVSEIQGLSVTQPFNLSLQRMCYASIITAMEAYLGDILKREIFSRTTIKERFVACYEPFKKMKFSLAEIYVKLVAIDSEIKDALDGLSLHKIDTAKNIFSDTLLTEFPAESLPFLGAAVKLRHDIVHRNGRDTEGTLIRIEQKSVDELAQHVLQFTRAIDAQIRDGLLLDHENGETDSVL